MKVNDEWEEIGVVTVDSGQIMVCDPCVIGDDFNDEFTYKDFDPDKFSYNTVSNITNPNIPGQFLLKALNIRTCYGDGIYPVYGHFLDGQMVEIRIPLNYMDLNKKGKLIEPEIE